MDIFSRTQLKGQIMTRMHLTVEVEQAVSALDPEHTQQSFPAACRRGKADHETLALCLLAEADSIFPESESPSSIL